MNHDDERSDGVHGWTGMLGLATAVTIGLAFALVGGLLLFTRAYSLLSDEVIQSPPSTADVWVALASGIIGSLPFTTSLVCLVTVWKLTGDPRRAIRTSVILLIALGMASFFWGGVLGVGF